MLNADAIKEIRSTAIGEVQDIEGKKFHVNHAGAKALEYPAPDTLHVFSLSQLVSYIMDTLEDEECFVNVLSHDRVQVGLKARTKNEKLQFIVNSDFSKQFEAFPFGEKLEQEEFIIELQTKFVKDAALEQLLALTNKVKADRVTESGDDGYSQVVTTKVGAHLAATEKVPNLWYLKTYKTFAEIEQPVIPYILRLHQRSSEMPEFALYDCDGGKWKLGTTMAIRSWLKDQLQNKSKTVKVL